jgi:hypothetical protein
LLCIGLRRTTLRMHVSVVPLQTAAWSWSAPIAVDGGDVTVKLRRFLQGQHQEPTLVGPLSEDAAALLAPNSADASSADLSQFHIESSSLNITERRPQSSQKRGVSPAQVRARHERLNRSYTFTRCGVPLQVCWLRAQVAAQDATTYFTVMPHPLLMPADKRILSLRIDNACSVDAVWIRQVSYASKV